MIESNKADELNVSLLQTCARAGLASWTYDVLKHTIQLSPQFRDLLELSDTAVEMDYEQFVTTFVHPDDAWYVREYQRVPAARKYSFRVISSNGKEYWLEAFPTAENENGARSISGVVQNITERMANEDGIHNARKMESVRSIAGGIAHEFNNILYSMSGYIGLLKELATEEEINRDEMDEFLAEVEHGNNRAVQLIKKIQTFSHSGRQGVKAVCLNEAVSKAIVSLPKVEHVEVEDNVSDSPLVMVYANQVTLGEGILNILANGMGAMAAEGGTLTVLLERTFVEESRTVQCGKLQTGHYGCVVIRDTGCGMDKNTISRIFEPFYTTKQAGRGTGLGLAIVFGLVNAANGAVEVESRLGVGSTFRVYLPACSTMSGETDENDAHTCN